MIFVDEIGLANAQNPKKDVWAKKKKKKKVREKMKEYRDSQMEKRKEWDIR